jgi:hypothetical protein
VDEGEEYARKMPVLSLPLAVLPTMGIKVNHAGNVTSSTGIALFVYVTQDSGFACAEALGEAGRVLGECWKPVPASLASRWVTSAEIIRLVIG